MIRQCPECDGDLTELDPRAEMGSAPMQYDCPECQLRFETDPAGGLREVDP